MGAFGHTDFAFDLSALPMLGAPDLRVKMATGNLMIANMFLVSELSTQ